MALIFNLFGENRIVENCEKFKSETYDFIKKNNKTKFYFRLVNVQLHHKRSGKKPNRIEDIQNTEI